MAIITGTNFNDNNTVNGVPLFFRPALIGTINDDIINGLAGDDWIVGGFGFDTMDGGDGIDTLDNRFFNNAYRLNMVTGATNLLGETAINFEHVFTGSGDDVIIGTADDNYIDTGAGDDTVNAGAGADTIVGREGNDSLNGEAGDDTILGGTGNDNLDGGAGTDSIFGGLGDDTLSQNFGGPNELLDGGAGTDTADWSYSTADWTISLVTNTADIGAITFANLVSIENVIGAGGNDTITGNNLDNVLAGGAGNDDINGGAGNDVLLGGVGDDNLDGGAGTDSIFGGLGDDTLSQNFGGPNELLDGGAGTDTADWSYSTADWTISLVTNTADIGAITFANLVSIENVVGAAGNDDIMGNNLDNALNGGAGDDRIDGAEGDDTLLGSSGNDLLTGGLGDNYLNGTDYLSQGTGERDRLRSDRMSNQDIFVLGERQDGFGRVFYNDQGNLDYAVIENFDLYNFAGDISDRIQLVGSSGPYSITNVNVGGVTGAGIRRSGDLIGIVEGINAFNLNLSDSTQFTYV
ncbi:MAG: calcium-binding protein [Symploca sp. SIO2B6]|nr:calcium-binding protein [Symploca sp. SIO2B6]